MPESFARRLGSIFPNTSLNDGRHGYACDAQVHPARRWWLARGHCRVEMLGICADFR